MPSIKYKVSPHICIVLFLFTAAPLCQAASTPEPSFTFGEMALPVSGNFADIAIKPHMQKDIENLWAKLYSLSPGTSVRKNLESGLILKNSDSLTLLDHSVASPKPGMAELASEAERLFAMPRWCKDEAKVQITWIGANTGIIKGLSFVDFKPEDLKQANTKDPQQMLNELHKNFTKFTGTSPLKVLIKASGYAVHDMPKKFMQSAFAEECHLLDLARELAPAGYRVISQDFIWERGVLNRALTKLGVWSKKDEATLAKPQLVLTTKWHEDAKTGNWLVEGSVWDGIFGKQVPSNFGVWQAGQLPKEVIGFFDQIATRLDINQKPEIVGRKGPAWAYLNVGRGWGLKPGDRLIDGSGKIKGHVISFFGPEEKLVDAKGNLIHEGAVVFIRKGQSLAVKGVGMNFDPQTFP